MDMVMYVNICFKVAIKDQPRLCPLQDCMAQHTNCDSCVYGQQLFCNATCISRSILDGKNMEHRRGCQQHGYMRLPQAPNPSPRANTQMGGGFH